jgi:glutaredoxin
MRRLLASPWTLLLVAALVWAGLQGWRSAQAARLGPEVARAAGAGDIRMISSLTCRYCTQARAWFTEHGVAFSECFVEREEGCAQAYAALQAPGTPVLLVRDTRLVGFSPRRIADALR